MALPRTAAQPAPARLPFLVRHLPLAVAIALAALHPHATKSGSKT
jgi:outer membrane receptor for ferric coprogen and ferric-rhodotorulic acid